jgi:uncharacterized membrane protein YphA (DoxX/SURF4 family)
MKYLPAIAGIFLGLLFLMAAVPVLFNLIPPEKMPPPPNEEAKMFIGAFGPTGYLTFVKVLELIGGILVMVPRTRNVGQLVLGPIIVNIVAYHAFIIKGGLLSPMLIAIVVLSLFLLWAERRAWLGLLKR